MTKEEIQQIVEDVFLLKVKTRSRKIDNIIPSYVYYDLAYKYTTNSFERIGYLTNRTHATVMNGIKKLPNLIISYPEKEFYYIECERRVLEKCSPEDTKNYFELKFKFESRYKSKEAKVISPEKRGVILKVSNQLKNLSDEDVLDFIETRLNPYLNMLKSRVVKETKVVKGAKRKFSMKC